MLLPPLPAVPPWGGNTVGVGAEVRGVGATLLLLIGGDVALSSELNRVTSLEDDDEQKRLGFKSSPGVLVNSKSGIEKSWAGDASAGNAKGNEGVPAPEGGRKASLSSPLYNLSVYLL